MNKARRKIVAGIVGLFVGFVAIIFVMAVKQVVSPQMALLMFIALLGLYFGFGVLIAVYRMIGKLE